MTTTLSELKTRARQRADQENSLFVAESELTTYINQSYFELYDILISKFEDYYLTTENYVVASGSRAFSLPSDFYKLRGLDFQLGSQYCDVPKFDFNQRNQTQSGLIMPLYGVPMIDVNYRVAGSQVLLTPTDGCQGTYRLWYVPQAVALVSNTDTIDVIAGFDEYVVVDAAIKMMMKEESDIKPLLIAKQALLDRLERMSANRDAGKPSRIVSTRRGGAGGAGRGGDW